MNRKYKYSLGLFIGVTMALVANVRSVPTIAATGWTQISYLLFGAVFFAIPVCLIAGEFGSAFPGNGGPQLWVSQSLGERWGFVVAFLLWAQMFPGMVMVASTLGPLIGEVFGQPQLSQNHWFAFICILATIWIIGLLSFNHDVAKMGGKYGVWIGIYLPAAVLMVLGLAACIKTGIRPSGYLGAFAWDKVLPGLSHSQSLSLFGSIVFLFAGIEMTSVYIPELKDSRRNYPLGIFLSLLLMCLINVFDSLFTANEVDKGEMQLSNVSYPIIRFTKILGLPQWIPNVFALCVAIGVVLQVSAWINGPCHTMSQAARDGSLPPQWGFHKTNKYDISRNLMWTQIIGLTVIACLYVLPINVNVLFITLTNAASLLYMIVYIFLAVAVLRLRYQRPGLNRPMRIGRRGNGLVWVVVVILLAAICAVIASILLASSSVLSLLIVLAIAVAVFVAPLIINARYTPEWREEVRTYESKQE